MPCASRADFSEAAAEAKALLVMMTRSAPFLFELSVDAALTTICAGACTRSSPKAKIVRVPAPVAAKETLFLPSAPVATETARNCGACGSVRSTTLT